MRTEPSKPRHGGTRQGAGRKAAYGEPTKTVRVPQSLVPMVVGYLDEMKRLDMEIASEFITMASHLMLIKTKMLLSAAEQQEAEDELDLLTIDPAPDRQALIGAPGAASDSAPAGSPLPMAVEVRAPGWKLLGHTRPTGQPPLDAERVWITWRAGA